MSWSNLSNPFIDPAATVTIAPNPLGGTQITLTGSTPAPAQSEINFLITEPAEGWSNGMTITLNTGTIPQAATYNSPLGQYSTVVGGVMTLDIVYIELDPATGDPLPGGIIAGNFSGSMGDLLGVGAPTTISDGSFLLEMP
jgi:hypothetical protein